MRNRFRLKVQVIVWQGEAQTCFEASHTLKVDQVIGSLIGLIIILKMVILNMTNMTVEMPASLSWYGDDAAVSVKGSPQKKIFFRTCS